MRGAMRSRGGAARHAIWRHAFALVAAYLLALQAALAGGSMASMQAHGDPAWQVNCLNSDASAPADQSSDTSPFDCCGVGCLVGAQTLQSPDSPEQALVYPSALRFEQAREPVGPRAHAAPTHGPSPRGPPAIG